MDLQKTTNQLKIGFSTAENQRTKYITLNDPRSNLTAQDIRTAAQYLVDNNILWNDSYGDSYTSVVTAYKEVKTVTDLDLEDF